MSKRKKTGNAARQAADISRRLIDKIQLSHNLEQVSRRGNNII